MAAAECVAAGVHLRVAQQRNAQLLVVQVEGRATAGAQQLEGPLVVPLLAGQLQDAQELTGQLPDELRRENQQLDRQLLDVQQPVGNCETGSG